MTDKDEGGNDADKKDSTGEVSGRSTRMLSICPHCGARHHIVNDTKGVWVCPDCGKSYDPY
jgi:ribosomal protein L37AE/L43A